MPGTKKPGCFFKTSRLYKFIKSSDFHPFPIGEKIYLRLFLTSSRSLKYNVLKNKTFNDELKDLIILTELPKFTWVAELTNKTLAKKRMANGLILFDATELDSKRFKSLIFSAHN